MKYWFVKDENEVLHVVGAKGFVPKDVICEAPEGEEIDWIEIVDGQAVVNETTKATVLAERQMAAASTKWDNLRAERNRRLTASDWTQLNDSPLKDDPSWLQYRQDLRDLPSNTLDPDQVVYPNEPN